MHRSAPLALDPLLPPGRRGETGLLDLAADRIDPTANVRYLFDAGSALAQTLDPANVVQHDTYLLDWLTVFVHDDPAWTSVKP